MRCGFSSISNSLACAFTPGNICHSSRRVKREKGPERVFGGESGRDATHGVQCHAQECSDEGRNEKTEGVSHVEPGEDSCHPAGGVARKRRETETHGAGAPCGMKESGASDSLSLHGLHKGKGAPRPFGIGGWLLADGCWTLPTRQKSRTRKPLVRIM